MQKRGGTLLEEAGGLALAAIVIVVAIYLLANMLGPGAQSTIVQFGTLETELNELLNNPAQFAAIENRRFDIEDGYMIIGFNTEWDDYAKTVDYSSSTSGDYNAFKPTECGTSACVCLYEEDGINDWPEFFEKDEKDDDVIKCIVLASDTKKKIVFMGHYANQKGGVVYVSHYFGGTTYNPNDKYYYDRCKSVSGRTFQIPGNPGPDFIVDPCEYTHLVMWGDPPSTLAANWGSRNLYIEKMVWEDTIYFYFAEKPLTILGLKEALEKRYRYLNEVYGSTFAELKESLRKKGYIDVLAQIETGQMKVNAQEVAYLQAHTLFEMIKRADIVDQYQALQIKFKEIENNYGKPKLKLPSMTINMPNDRKDDTKIKEARTKLHQLAIEKYLEAFPIDTTDITTDVARAMDNILNLQKLPTLNMPPPEVSKERLQYYVLGFLKVPGVETKRTVFEYFLKYYDTNVYKTELYDFAKEAKNKETKSVAKELLQELLSKQTGEEEKLHTQIILLQLEPENKELKTIILQICKGKNYELCSSVHEAYILEKPNMDDEETYSLITRESRKNALTDIELYVDQEMREKRPDNAIEAYTDFINAVLKVSELTTQDREMLAHAYKNKGQIIEKEKKDKEKAKIAYQKAKVQAIEAKNTPLQQEIQDILDTFNEEAQTE